MIARRIATATVAGLALLALAGCGGNSGPTPEQKDDAHRAAGLWCSFMSGASSIYSDEFLNCVKEREPVELADIVKKEASK